MRHGAKSSQGHRDPYRDQGLLNGAGGWRRPKWRPRQDACRTFAEGSYELQCTVMQFATDVAEKKQPQFNNLGSEYLATNQVVVASHVRVGQRRRSRQHRRPN